MDSAGVTSSLVTAAAQVQTQGSACGGVVVARSRSVIFHGFKRQHLRLRECVYQLYELCV